MRAGVARCRRPLQLVLLLGMVAGCSGGSDPLLPDERRYLDRLAGVLPHGEHSVALQVPPFEPLPRPRALRFDAPRDTVDVLAFLRLHRCDLGGLVGLRNSSLGRVQTPSQRFAYEAALIAGLTRCSAADDDPDLQALLARKRKGWPQVVFNALFAGDEFRAFVATGQGPSRTAEDVVDAGRVAATLRALGTLAAANPASVDTGVLEPLLRDLRFLSLAGQQRRAWRRQTIWLAEAARRLDGAATTLCRNGRPTPRARNALNVFQRYYVGPLQGVLADGAQPDRGWLRELHRLVAAATLAGAPAQRLRDWHQSVFDTADQSEYGRWRTALDAHTRGWQRLLAGCGLAPRPAPLA